MAALPAAPGMAGMQMRMPMAGMPAQIPMLQPTSAGQLQPQIPRAPVQLKVGDRVRPTNDKRKYGFIESIDDDKQTAIVRWEGDAAGRGGPTRKKPKVLKHLALAEDESGPPKWTKRTQLNNRLTDQQKDVLKGARFQKFTFDPENEDSQREAVSLLQRLGIKREPSDPYPSKWVTRDSYVDFKGKKYVPLSLSSILCPMDRYLRSDAMHALPTSVCPHRAAWTRMPLLINVPAALRPCQRSPRCVPRR